MGWVDIANLNEYTAATGVIYLYLTGIKFVYLTKTQNDEHLVLQFGQELPKILL